MDCKLFLPADEKEALTAYLVSLYQGVFTAEAIDAHVENHVGTAFAGYTTQVIRPRLHDGARVLDIGCGFGSCVLAAREAGLDAFGVEIAEFEVEFARKRLHNLRPTDDPTQVYLCGDARKLDLAPESVDAITFWNVLEHIDDWQSVMEAGVRYLRPGGLVFIICPNYMAWRLEAHYHVPWKPAFLLSRNKAAEYLRSLGREPAYFENCIFYRTNWEVQRTLRNHELVLLDLGTCQSRALSVKNIFSMARHPRRWVNYYNPFRPSVEIAARKKIA
jgi:SAM-dependent methyltransferase